MLKIYLNKMIQLFRENIRTISQIVSLFKSRIDSNSKKSDTYNEDEKSENDGILLIFSKEADDLANLYQEKFNEFSDVLETKINLLKKEIILHKRINKQLRSENAKLKKI
ncbi:hypothetical protein [Chryseobacterium sp. MMS23-Vi53]|uniref:hypothetical protein n=1 Tax=Chryseobacterium sp. MMS23-Vi53 TaxID=3386644 RepID=UPI0039EC6712